MNLKEKFVIAYSEPLRNALQRINDLAIPGAALLVSDADGRITGTVTDGDIRRALLKGSDMQTTIGEIANRNFRFLEEGAQMEGRLKAWKALNIRFVPVLDASRRLVDVIDSSAIRGELPVEVVMMAGGVGERLRPLTESLPKPLLEVGGKAIIQRNVERLAGYSVSKFHICIRYLGEKIVQHLGDGSRFHTKIEYVREDKPLGTIGAVKEIGSFSEKYVLVMNSDLLTNIDFQAFFDFFISSGADMVVATVPYHVDVPYAVLQTDNDDKVVSFLEKPRYTYYSNAGIYLLKRELIDLVPKGEKFDATDLMEALIAKGYKLKSFPIVGYWLDIGRMDDYKKAQEDVKHLQF